MPCGSARTGQYRCLGFTPWIDAAGLKLTHEEHAIKAATSAHQSAKKQRQPPSPPPSPSHRNATAARTWWWTTRRLVRRQRPWPRRWGRGILRVLTLPLREAAPAGTGRHSAASAGVPRPAHLLCTLFRVHPTLLTRGLAGSASLTTHQLNPQLRLHYPANMAPVSPLIWPHGR